MRVAVAQAAAGRCPVSMTGQDIDATVRSAVARLIQLPPDAITGDADLEDDLGLDEDAAFAVVTAVEDLLDIRFPDDFLDGVQTYGELAAAIRVAVGP
jgi:acyl carrier protein